MPKGVYDRSHIKNEFWKHSPQYQQKLKTENPTTTRIERCRMGGPYGLAHFLNEHSIYVQHEDMAYRPLRLIPEQGEFIKEAFKAGKNRRWKHSIIAHMAPRRHTKSTIFAVALLWRTIIQKNGLSILLGNNEFHSRKTQFNILTNIIKHSKSLHKYFRPLDKCLLTNEIRCKYSGHSISMLSGTSSASSFGMKISNLWVSDLMACPDLQPFYNLQASTLDSRGSMIFVDSNPDEEGGPMSDLETMSKTDPEIYFHKTEYENFEEYLEKAPAFIDRKKAKRLQIQLLPADFDRDILGIRPDKTNALFDSATLEKCIDNSYTTPIKLKDFKALIGERTFITTASLDRSDSEWGSMLSGNDDSIATVLAKVAGVENSEEEYYLLDSYCFVPSTARRIKKYFLNAHEEYNLENISLESHNTTDIYHFMNERRDFAPVELVSPSSTWQNSAFPNLAAIARSGRLHIPESKDGLRLLSQMRTMQYNRLKNGRYSFGAGGKKSNKDDAVFSLVHGVYAGREAILNSYTLPRLICHQKSKAHRDLCYLFGGNLEMPCARDCEAHQMVVKYYESYMSFQTESELTIDLFYNNFVTLSGPCLWQAS
jgi:hypothetical protein